MILAAQIIGGLLAAIILILFFRFAFLFLWRVSGDMAEILAERVGNRMRYGRQKITN